MFYKSSVLAISLMLLSIGESILPQIGSANATETPTAASNTISNPDLLEIGNVDVIDRRVTLEPSIPIVPNPKTEASDLALEVTPIDPISPPVVSPARSNSTPAQIRYSESDPAKTWGMSYVSPLSDALSANNRSVVKLTGTNIAQTSESTPPTPESTAPTTTQPEPKKWSVGVHAQASTTGFIGVDAGYKFSPNFHARLGLNTVGFSTNYSSQGIDYNASVKPTNIHLLGDYFPFGGGLRLTGGFVIQNNRFTGSAKPNANNLINLNGVNYNASQVGTIESEGKFGNSVAPYLGIGFGTPISSGFGFNIDAGIMFAGSPSVALSANNFSSSIPISLQNQFQSNLAAQQQKTNADISSFNLYPVLSIGFSYAF
jgi:hypothetical protein